MSNIDDILKRTLSEMRDEQFGDEISPKNVSLFATNKLGLPITEEQAESAMQRKLSQKLSVLSLDEYVKEYGKEVIVAITKAMNEQEINHPLQRVDDFNRVPWTGYRYASLEAIHQVLSYYDAPDLLYERQ